MGFFRSVAITTGAILLTLSLSACEQQTDEKAQAAPKIDEASAALDKKSGHYTEGFNLLLIAGGGLESSAQVYDSWKIDQATADRTLKPSIATPMLESAVEQFKEGRALDTGEKTTVADSAVDKIVPPLETLISEWKPLQPYYDSGAYRDDDVAKGKAADPKIKAAFAESVAALGTLSDALGALQDQRNESRIAQMRDGGHEAEANFLDAIQKADRLARAASKEQFDEANAVVPDLQKALDAMRESAATYEGTQSATVIYAKTLENLTKMLGSWRDFRQNNQRVDLGTVISTYNSVIRTSASFPLPG